MPILITVVNSRVDGEFSFDSTPVVIGRLKRNDVTIRDNNVSREHARIVEEDGAYLVEDLDSTNFVFLRDEQIRKAPLSHGDVINIGGVANLIFLERPDDALRHRLLQDVQESPEYSTEAYALKKAMGGLVSEYSGVSPIPTGRDTDRARLARGLQGFKALYEFSYEINSTLDIGRLMDKLLQRILQVYGGDIACVLLKDASGDLRVDRSLDSKGQPVPGEAIRLDVAREAFGGREGTKVQVDDPGGRGSRCLMCVPLRMRSIDTGVLYVDSGPGTEAYTRRDLFLFEAMAHQAASAIHNAHLISNLEEKQRLLQKANEDLSAESARLTAVNEQLDEKIRELSALNAVSRGMNMVKDHEEVLRLILEKMLEVLRAEKGSLMLCNHEKGTMDIRVILGVGEDGEPLAVPEESSSRLRIGEGIAGMALERGEPVAINEPLKSGSFKKRIHRERSVRSLMCVPLVREDEKLGVINISNKIDGPGFTEADKKLAVTLAQQAAITIENNRLYNEAIHDGLTGLHVHRYFQLMLEKEFERSRRYSESLSLVMLDIDNFKQINDNYGHQFGDIILQEVASLIRGSVRTVDLAARYGGEEFAVILPETDLEGAQVFAERLRQKIASSPFSWQDRSLPVTVSVGIATFPDCSPPSKDHLISFADEALYTAKNSGKNVVCLYETATPSYS